MRKYLWVILILWLFYLNGCTKKSGKSKDPNIIIIFADDLGYGDVSAYNKESKIVTPNLDKTASEGLMFTDAHTSSSVCTPSRYSLLTGRYNWRSTLKQSVVTGLSRTLIPNNRTTIAPMLKNHGYSTAFIGKWHLGWDWASKNDEKLSGGWDYDDFVNVDFSTKIFAIFS